MRKTKKSSILKQSSKYFWLFFLGIATLIVVVAIAIFKNPKPESILSLEALEPGKTECRAECCQNTFVISTETGCTNELIGEKCSVYGGLAGDSKCQNSVSPTPFPSSYPRSVTIRPLTKYLKGSVDQNNHSYGPIFFGIDFSPRTTDVNEMRQIFKDAQVIVRASSSLPPGTYLACPRFYYFSDVYSEINQLKECELLGKVTQAGRYSFDLTIEYLSADKYLRNITFPIELEIGGTPAPATPKLATPILSATVKPSAKPVKENCVNRNQECTSSNDCCSGMVCSKYGKSQKGICRSQWNLPFLRISK